MRSSKILRKPQRGALGNGLRVVAGAVLASGGSLTVTTRNKCVKLQPKADGSTAVVSSHKVEHPVGTRIEIEFGPTMPDDGGSLLWAKRALYLLAANMKVHRQHGGMTLPRSTIVAVIWKAATGALADRPTGRMQRWQGWGDCCCRGRRSYRLRQDQP